ncbi:retinoic acid receptor responder protein 2-like [Emys orbicularis]|uniref:retinoic acid receptor responder protein 2-like n=1 Tax=Emys orbicularis TaxID=82168 RepID=UPI0031FCC12B
MKGLLVLGLGLVALAAASELTLQERVVDLVLEAFHNRKVVQWVYKKQAMEDVTETEYPAGPFVRLRVKLQQTQCPNQPGSRQDCALKRRGRKQICLACVKFDSRSGGKVLDRYIHCRTEKQQPETETETTRHEEACSTVQETGEAPYHPGVFAFSRGLPS